MIGIIDQNANVELVDRRRIDLGSLMRNIDGCRRAKKSAPGLYDLLDTSLPLLAQTLLLGRINGTVPGFEIMGNDNQRPHEFPKSTLKIMSA
jgi:hypothetical protein